jgi:rubrerythrin
MYPEEAAAQFEYEAQAAAVEEARHLAGLEAQAIAEADAAQSEEEARHITQQPQAVICSPNICDYCEKKNNPQRKCSICGMGYPLFQGRKLTAC